MNWFRAQHSGYTFEQMKQHNSQDGGDECGIGDFGNSGFTTFSTFGRRHSRRIRGDNRRFRYRRSGRIG